MISPTPGTMQNPFPNASSLKQVLSQYAAYNLWANTKMKEILLTLPEGYDQKELPASFKTMYQTLFHIWDAESIWWQRMKLHERLIIPSQNFQGSLADVLNGLLSQSQQWAGWVTQASELALDHVFQYHTSEKTNYKQPVWQVLMHVCNHGTYHRGQLVNMLRQLGVEKIPATDFIAWSRTKK